MKKIIILISLLCSLITLPAIAESISPLALITKSDKILQQAFVNHTSNLQVKGKGVVTKILSDDVIGDKHQRFILLLATGQTVLVAHNIDIAPRIKTLKLADVVNFYGEYEWNDQGGVIHWTHHDPSGIHVNGWLKHRGKTYQ